MGYAETVIATGMFHSAIVRHLFSALMRRDMLLDATDPDNELGLLAELATEFQGHDDFPILVKRLVQLPQYRRVR